MQFSSEEYESLRDEAIKRVDLYYTSNISTITIFFAALAGLATLMKVNALNFTTLLLAMLFTVLPLVIISPLAQKSYDNLRQMINLSSYIRVMYEYPSQLENGNNVKAWEGFNGLGYSSVPFLKTVNSEYAILAIWSAILNALLGIFAGITVLPKANGFSKPERVLTMFFLFIYAVITILMVRKIVLQYNTMNIFEKYSIQYQIHYLFVAKKLGHMDDNTCCEYFNTMIQDAVSEKNDKLIKNVNEALSYEKDKVLKDKFEKAFNSIVG